MKLILKNGKINITPMAIPEPRSKVFIEYVYERNTNHLTPQLHVNNHVFIGDRYFISFPNNLTDTIEMVVRLVDNEGTVVKEYSCEDAYTEYITLGTQPAYPNMITYIHELEQRIRTLEEEGELI